MRLQLFIGFEIKIIALIYYSLSLISLRVYQLNENCIKSIDLVLVVIK